MMILLMVPYVWDRKLFKILILTKRQYPGRVEYTFYIYFFFFYNVPQYGIFKKVKKNIKSHA